MFCIEIAGESNPSGTLGPLEIRSMSSFEPSRGIRAGLVACDAPVQKELQRLLRRFIALSGVCSIRWYILSLSILNDAFSALS